jgi:phosphate/sulfate permease
MFTGISTVVDEYACTTSDYMAFIKVMQYIPLQGPLAMAWVLTLPAAIMMSGTLYYVFRLIF